MMFSEMKIKTRQAPVMQLHVKLRGTAEIMYFEANKQQKSTGNLFRGFEMKKRYN